MELTRTEMRRACLARRSAVARGEPVKVRLLAENASRWLSSLDRCTLGFYLAFRDEPDLAAAVSAWLSADPDRIAAVPVVDDYRAGLMHFCRWHPGCALEENRWGIPEPVADEPVVPEAMIAPAVGFDRRGYRLGYGAGFYDRWLARATSGTVKALAAYSVQEAEGFAPGPDDVPFDVIITEDGVFEAAQ